MNRDECQKLIDSYLDWLRRGLAVEEIEGGVCELTTPFLDRHNDHLQVYALKRNGVILLTDDGYVLADLRAGGVDVNTPKRRSVVEGILRGFGVKLNNSQLVIEASEKNLGQRVHSLVQAMLAVNDMFVLAQPRVAAFFWEDVKKFLDDHGVRYSPRVKLAGRSGFDHGIDFLIPRSRNRPERLVEAISYPSRNTIGAYLFSLSDTREVRGEDAEAFAFLNDRDRAVGAEIVEALENYDVKPALWSRRQELVEALAG